MATIKGLTLEINGDTTLLSKALSDVNKQSRDLTSELRQTERLLKLDPKSTELLSQKQKILAESIANTNKKLETLKDAERQAQEQFKQGKIGEDQYRAIQREVIKTEEELKKMNKQLKEMDWTSVTDGLDKFSKKAKDIGKNLTKTVTAPIVAVGGLATKSAVEFESAFAGVKKTIDGSEEDFARLEAGIRKMAKEIPATTTEIAGVAEAAGQLGIETDNVLDFTRVMIDLGESTNLSAEEAATSFARFANIVGMSQEDFDKLGSVVVDLGNNLATTESEIVSMGMRLAGAGSQIGLSESQILSFAGALSSVGIESEAGGTAFSKVMGQMQLAVETGSDKLQDFAKVAGMTTDEFSTSFKEDASGAILAFIEGLGDAEAQGSSALKVLDDMGISEIRLRDALLRASGASDVFSNALKIGTEAWEENSALAKEAAQRYETYEAQLQIFKNKIADLGITIGNIILPTLIKLVDLLSKVFEWFAELSPELQRGIVIVAGVAAAIGPLIWILGSLAASISAMITLVGGAGGLSAVIAALTGPIGIAIAAIVAITAVIVELWKTNDNFKDGVKKVWENIKAIISGAIQVIKGVLQVFISLMTGDFAKFTEGIKNLWSGMWQVLINIIGGAGNLVLTAFGTLGESIMKFFAGLISNAYDWGKNLISGFVDGIKSMASSVSSAVSNVVGGVKDYFTGRTINGTHANGLANVPFDGYVARLHKDERVLTARENREYSQGLSGVSNSFNIASIVVREEADIRKIAQELYRLQQQRNRGRGIYA